MGNPITLSTDTNKYASASVRVNVKDTNVVLIALGVVIWVVTGFVSFLMSLFCFRYSGSQSQHAIGVAIAIFLGPFFWLYYFFNKQYCR